MRCRLILGIFAVPRNGLLIFLLQIIQISSWLSTTGTSTKSTTKHSYYSESLPHIGGSRKMCCQLLQNLGAKLHINDTAQSGLTSNRKFTESGQPTIQRFDSIFASDLPARAFLSTIIFICLCSVYPEVCIAFVGPENDVHRPIQSIAAPSHNTKSEKYDEQANLGNQQYQWVFENGNVELPEMIDAYGLKLTSPQLLGSGAGGAVFVLQNEPTKSQLSHGQISNVGIPSQIALKVSWKASAKSVAHECQILQQLQDASKRKHGRTISTIETCLGELRYKADVSRTMIILQPVFIETQAVSLQDFLSEPDKMMTSVTLIIRTLIQMLSENIVTIDVQPLISRDTGQILFVDFTEAATIDTQGKITGEDASLIRNFINEMMILIPDSVQDTAIKEIFQQELIKYPIDSIELTDMLIEQ